MDEVGPHIHGTDSAPESGGIFRLEELTYTQVEALDRARVAVLLSVSPLEEHGPHLPVGTDLLTSGAICANLAERIIEAKPGWTVLIGPSIPIGASAFDSAGTLLARARTVRNVTLDYGASLA
ncbi:MAG TPA: creatininase family protein, partial [Terriglobia bacterium]|nr:creatininase family protein [Terriglobia bacterium]